MNRFLYDHTFFQSEYKMNSLNEQFGERREQFGERV